MNYPFQSQEYRDLFKKHFIPDTQSCVLIENTEYELLPDNRAVFVGMKPVLNGQELTDYSNIENPTKENLLKHLNILKKDHHINSVQFDYVREDSMLFRVLSELSTNPPIQQEVAPFIAIPSTWDLYLESLERTDRKELKRKWKRLDTIPHEFKTLENPIPEKDFDIFISLHKLSDTRKEQFMSDPMKNFFRDLLAANLPGWKQKLAFLYREDKPAASILYFENSEQLLLYNSGYDPKQKYYSAGLLLCANLIKQAIESKKKTFDFLRGNERYKHDLGGRDMKLYKFMISLH